MAIPIGAVTDHLEPEAPSFCPSQDLAPQTEEAVSGLRQRLDLYFHFTPMAVIESSPNGTVVDCNPAAERIFGFKREEVLGKNSLELCVAPEAVEEISRRFDELFATKKPFYASNGNRAVDGRAIIGEWFNVPILDAGGNVTSVVSAMLDVTEHRRVETALVERDRQYRLLAEYSSDIVSLHDLEGKYLYVSPSVTRLTGFTPEELDGIEFYQIVHPDDRERVRAEAHAKLLDGSSAHISWRRLRKDGSYFPAETAAQVIRDEHGKPWRLVAATRDVTARHEAKQALRQSEEAWRSLVENSPDYVAKLDADGRIDFINRPPAGDLECVIGWRLTDCAAAEDGEALTSLLGRARATGQTQSLELRLRWSGEPRWFQLRVVPASHDGRPESSTLIATDVTDSRRAAEALRASEEQFRQIAENMREACWVIEPGDVVSHASASHDASAHGITPSGTGARGPRWVYVGPAFEAITGRPRDLLYDDPFSWTSFVHPDDRTPLPADVPAWRAGMSSEWDREYRIVHADGTVRWVKDSGFPLRDAAGNLTRVTGVFEDITARKANEELLVGHNEHLDRLVREQTAQVRELERQRVESEKVIATGRMAARVAHEINNPLAGIRNAFDLVKDAIPPDHPYYGYVPRITDEIDRISRIVRQMFEVHRPAAERAMDFAPDACVRDVIALVGPIARERGVSVECDCRLPDVSARLPQHSFRQVLHNLIQNAIEASRPGSSVVVRTGEFRAGELTFGALREANREASHEAGALQVSVIDNGTGVPEDIRTAIFEPFFTTKGHWPRPGLGLGLSVSDGMVRAMGGRIEFECPAEGGSHFSIILPYSSGIDDSIAPAQVAPAQVAPAQVAPAQVAPAQVAVAGDSQTPDAGEDGT